MDNTNKNIWLQFKGQPETESSEVELVRGRTGASKSCQLSKFNRAERGSTKRSKQARKSGLLGG